MIAFMAMTIDVDIMCPRIHKKALCTLCFLFSSVVKFLAALDKAYAPTELQRPIHIAPVGAEAGVGF